MLLERRHTTICFMENGRAKDTIYIVFFLSRIDYSYVCSYVVSDVVTTFYIHVAFNLIKFVCGHIQYFAITNIGTINDQVSVGVLHVWCFVV